MNVTIINDPFKLKVYGFSAITINKDYVGTAFKLMDKMWQSVNSNHLKNKGLNIWVYEADDRMFAGVELEDDPAPEIGLQLKNISLYKYAYFRHIGSYHLIKQVGQAMATEIKQRGFDISLPYIEIYGHWTKDETKLETELLMSLI